MMKTLINLFGNNEDFPKGNTKQNPKSDQSII